MAHISLFAAITMAATTAQAASPNQASAGDADQENAAIAAVLDNAHRDADAIARHLAEHRAAHLIAAPGWPCAKAIPGELAVAAKSPAGVQGSAEPVVRAPRSVECAGCAECAHCGEVTPDDMGCSGCHKLST